MKFELGKGELNTRVLSELANTPGNDFKISSDTWQRLETFRAIIDKAAKGSEQVYGINTGFGFLANKKIPIDEVVQLQVNLIRSHACGVGEHSAPETVRAMMIIKTHNFLQGNSGVSRECVEALLAFLKHDVIPVVPCKGSVGASGDLAPLSHIALGLMGEGEVYFEKQLQNSKDVLKKLGLKPYTLKAKEGLALINGTQYMSGLGSLILESSRTLMKAADAISALSLDATRGSLKAYDEKIHTVRKQPGQLLVSQNVLALFEGSDAIMDSHKDCGKVQDPYSFRCVPQVHGACRDLLKHVEVTLNHELNSATDNPLVFENGEIISGGNFHGQPIAFALDILAMALAEIGSISERRIEKMTNPHTSGLPAFLTKNEGLNSGFMIPHVVAASLVSENKILSHPASVDSIPTSADKEDHVSMGPISANKARQSATNVSHILAIELLTACQGLDVLKPLKPAKHLQAIHKELRKISSFVDEDRVLSKEIEKVAKWLVDKGLDKALDSSGLQLK